MEELNNLSVTEKLAELDDAMGSLGFHQANSVEEALEATPEQAPTPEKSNFTPIPKKMNGVYFQLKRVSSNRTEIFMHGPDGDAFPTGVGWDKR